MIVGIGKTKYREPGCGARHLQKIFSMHDDHRAIAVRFLAILSRNTPYE